MWNLIKIAISVAWSVIKVIFNTIVWTVRNILGPIFTWFYRLIILPLWALIRIAIGSAWGGIKLVFQAIVWFVKNILGPIFRWLYRNVVEPSWNGLKTIISGGWNFIRDKVFTPMRNGLSRLGDAFRNTKDGISDAWSKVKKAVKDPIVGGVEIINKFINGYNGINDWWKGKDLSTIKTDGWATGGWTGPGSTYKPAGVVHADEFVIKKSSQNSISRAAPGYLDSLNRHGAKALGTPGYATGGRVRPLSGGTISQGFHSGHNGVDFAAPSGTPVYAAADGVVKSAGWSAYGGGNEIQIQHPSIGNLVTWYSHLTQKLASVGDQVKAGQIIGKVGSTGYSTGPHLHFMALQGGWPNYFNPADFLGGLIGDGSGGGGGLFASAMSKLEEFVTQPLQGFKDKYKGNIFMDMASGIFTKAVDGVKSLIPFLDDDTSSNTNTGAGVDQWKDISTKALKMTGDYTPGNLSALLRRMNQESGGNPNAVNNWDSNALAGTPSKGLMQVIQPTFDRYKRAGYNNIMDPMANILASINYTKATYGSLTGGWGRAGGYSSGGLVSQLFDGGGWLHKTNDPMLIQHKKDKPDAVLTYDQNRAYQDIAENIRSGGNAGATQNIYVERYKGEDGTQLGDRLSDRLAFRS